MLLSIPLPLRGTFSVGILESFEEIDSVAFFTPSDAGEKAAPIVQVPDFTIVLSVQLSLVMLKS